MCVCVSKKYIVFNLYCIEKSIYIFYNYPLHWRVYAPRNEGKLFNFNQ